ncbi:MAG: aminotransferase class III-fold pyridoxal phosphate-dependent enzyme [Candidatus Bathyarchaeia archaeon]
MGSPKILVTPPGPKARRLLFYDEKFLSPSLRRLYPLAIESGRDCIVRDMDGNEYIDFNSGLSCLNVGHSHPRVVEAVKEQIDKFSHYSQKAFYYEVAVKLAEELCNLTPGSFGKRVFLSNSGTEAVEASIKLVRWHYRRPILLSYINAWHGETLGSLTLSTHTSVQRRHLMPLLPNIVHIPYPYCYRCPFDKTFPECSYTCLRYVDDYVLGRIAASEDVAAVYFEPIQAEGCIVPPPEYFGRLRKIADENGFAMVDDESETGIGRIGRWFGIEEWNVTPDIICVAGGLASGLPLGATICRSEIMDWEPETHSSIFGGNPLSCTAALTVVEIIKEENLLGNTVKQGNHVLHRLKEMMEEYELIGDVRGCGLMVGMELVKNRKTKIPAEDEAEKITIMAFKRGIALRRSGSTIIISPPLTISRETVDSGLDILDAVFREFMSGL